MYPKKTEVATQPRPHFAIFYDATIINCDATLIHERPSFGDSPQKPKLSGLIEHTYMRRTKLSLFGIRA
jgi:hypothetical protein